ncbi:23S rRNA (cytidine1920-2'-O)/16S rRNA (cytidine1409-2'-O)-methyltransferase [Rhizobiales bacterium GAS191]|nr:23S rRNA (cytidine1920-2'-O)/16S rRNA (cytidine1409-2'-O)-methyltransferase [Rhizobiales bacterium GAS191]
MSESKRADILLVERGYFESRARARAAIEAGLVSADGMVVQKPSARLDAGAALEATSPHPYVSRGGVKLEAALQAFGFDPAGRACLDIGASTGGFSHVLLDRGARRVVGVDVGHGQLHASLTREPRLVSLEGQDIRSLDADAIGEAPSLVVIDVSFISLIAVLPAADRLAASQALLVALVKPQFEVGRRHLKKGVVRDEEAQREACRRAEQKLAELGWAVVGTLPSPIAGGDGNREFLIGAVR